MFLLLSCRLLPGIVLESQNLDKYSRSLYAELMDAANTSNSSTGGQDYADPVGQKEGIICLRTKSDKDFLDDGYNWKKYGQKHIKNRIHPTYSFGLIDVFSHGCDLD